MSRAQQLLPNLFIVGAAKCGTSSLHHYLDQHPSISMSTHKEPEILSKDDWQTGIERYTELLDAGARVRGEGSTNYAKYPTFTDVPARIAGLVPDAKLVYVVGEPVARSIAHYVENVAGGLESRPIHEALGNFDDRMNTYVWTSRYATQLEQYLEHFPRSSILVLDKEDLRSRRLETVREAFRFLGVDDAFSSPRFEELLNTRSTKRRMSDAGAKLQRSRAAALARKVPARLRGPFMRSAVRLVSRPVRRPELDPGLQAEMEALFVDELDRFADLTGKRFCWDGLRSG